VSSDEVPSSGLVIPAASFSRRLKKLHAQSNLDFAVPGHIFIALNAE